MVKAIIPVLDDNVKRPYYLQVYDYIKQAILHGEMRADEKLPSLRGLATQLSISITTIEQAYNQLTVEGYIYSKPQSGYFVSSITHAVDTAHVPHNLPLHIALEEEVPTLLYDLACFNFTKWKKCMAKILTEYSPLLLFESDPQGEAALRHEISQYIYRSRGAICTPEQIVIGAGTQQITGQLTSILSKMGIGHIAVEEPGYLPVRSIFRDRGFVMTPVPVGREGVNIALLPSNIPSAVYVSPSNQFPTGAVMPVGKRYELLDWANRNNSIILEDDYDSELRYFGKPIPAMQGLDTNQRVVYLGSFSSTTFSSMKISYMVLPPTMAKIFRSICSDYVQTCSKTEQLTLALFMEQGLYQTNIKKLRNLYAQKLQALISAFSKYGSALIKPINTSSGINIIINVETDRSAEDLCASALELGILAIPVSLYTEGADSATSVIIYYNRIPLDQIDPLIAKLVKKW